MRGSDFVRVARMSIDEWRCFCNAQPWSDEVSTIAGARALTEVLSHLIFLAFRLHSGSDLLLW
jgi:hypothetical protein